MLFIWYDLIYLIILFFSSDVACSSHHGSKFNCFSFGKIILYEVVKKPEKEWNKIEKKEKKNEWFNDFEVNDCWNRKKNKIK